MEPIRETKIDGRRRAGAQTRRRLIDAGIDLLAAGGMRALTLRAVSKAADANVAAVKYHFGSLEYLVGEVVGAAVGHVIEAQTSALEALRSSTDARASGAAWIEAWARPLVQVAVSAEEDERRLGRIIGQTFAAPSDDLDIQVRERATVPSMMLIRGLEQALPDVDPEEWPLRLALMASSLAGLASGAFEPWLARSGPERELADRILERVKRLALG